MAEGSIFLPYRCYGTIDRIIGASSLIGLIDRRNICQPSPIRALIRTEPSERTVRNGWWRTRQDYPPSWRPSSHGDRQPSAHPSPPPAAAYAAGCALAACTYRYTAAHRWQISPASRRIIPRCGCARHTHTHYGRVQRRGPRHVLWLGAMYVAKPLFQVPTKQLS
jgi:hypothetical protein